MTFGALVMAFAPVTGTVMMSRAQMSSEIVVRRAEVDPKFAEVLERYLSASTWAQLGTIVATWAFAAAVDFNRIPADSAVAQMMIGPEIQSVIEANRERDLRRQQAAAMGEAAPGPVGPNGKQQRQPWAAPVDVGGA